MPKYADFGGQVTPIVPAMDAQAAFRWNHVLYQLTVMRILIARDKQHPIGPSGNSHEAPQNIPA